MALRLRAHTLSFKQGALWGGSLVGEGKKKLYIRVSRGGLGRSSSPLPFLVQKRRIGQTSRMGEPAGHCRRLHGHASIEQPSFAPGTA